MSKIFKILLTSYPRALISMFFVAFFTSFGVLFVQELVVNVEESVAKESRPLLGADIAVRSDQTFTGNLRDIIHPALGDTSKLVFSEKIELETTLFDTSGKTGLVKIVIVDENYPMRSVFDRKILPGVADASTGISVTQNVIDRFVVDGKLTLDDQKFTITAVIQESSELGIGFGDEGYLVILPKKLSEKLSFLERGARYERNLLINTSEEWIIDDTLTRIREEIQKDSNTASLRANSYRTNAARTNEAVAEFGRYTILVIVFTAIFAAVTLYNGFSLYLDRIRPFLRVATLLGLTRVRKWIPLGVVLGGIMSSSLVLSILCIILIIEWITRFPAAEELVFQWWPVGYAAGILGILFVSVILPGVVSFIGESPIKKEKPTRAHILFVAWLSITGLITFLSLVFAEFWKPLLLVGWGMVGVGILWTVIYFFYRISFSGILRRFFYTSKDRHEKFTLYDGFRTIIRPGSPAVLMTTFLTICIVTTGIFFAISLTFRERLTIDSTSSVNVYALNILESDEKKVREAFPGKELFSILRGRIIQVNGKSLAEHLGTPKPSREFTREFSITTNSLDTKSIVRWSVGLGPTDISVDEEFSGRIKLDVGDTIRIALSGREFTLTVKNIRSRPKAQGFQPFFYFQVNPEGFASAPRNFFLSDRASDIEKWKGDMVRATGSHVSFVDIAKITAIIQDIAGKLLVAVLLFFAFLVVYGILASLSLLEQMKESIAIKKKLYTYLGSPDRTVRISTYVTLGSILLTAGVLIVGAVVAGYIGLLSIMTFLSFSYTALWLSIGFVFALLVGLFGWCVLRFR